MEEDVATPWQPCISPFWFPVATSGPSSVPTPLRPDWNRAVGLHIEMTLGPHRQLWDSVLLAWKEPLVEKMWKILDPDKDKTPRIPESAYNIKTLLWYLIVKKKIIAKEITFVNCIFLRWRRSSWFSLAGHQSPILGIRRDSAGEILCPLVTGCAFRDLDIECALTEVSLTDFTARLLYNSGSLKPGIKPQNQSPKTFG